ncbi:AraC family transcriptional regulator [Fictibacillus fluitans]|uniref:AraC family transcriptional regulator n=1 Tax=Fictibacillus fluitans TaxID=3058422 RepID=A0ABT8HQD4_9BACL|nr:AraC family transcriptional regulator [Fictibacillus sp. NE201]MDN4522981.1 AraC family transcriptional regulator [Fictibacillus sp. NE201]
MQTMRVESAKYMTEMDFPFWVKRFIHTDFNIPPAHSHEFVELIFVVKGKGEHVFEGVSYPIKQNDIFIINPGEVHTYTVQSGESLEIINCLFLPNLINHKWLKELGISESMDFFYIHPFLNEKERFHHRINLNDRHSTRILDLLNALMFEFEARKPCFMTLVRLQIVELFILLSRIFNEKRINSFHSSESNQDNIIVQRIRGYLERHYDEKICIPELCHLFGISSRHLNRVFKKVCGKTVIEWVHQIRIDKAKYLLIHSDEKVITVATKVGYEDPAFFSKLFQRMVGCSPGKYKLKEQ